MYFVYILVCLRVDGQLHGVRIRRNFKSREAAAAEKAALEIKAEQDLSGLRSITTALTVEQARGPKPYSAVWKTELRRLPTMWTSYLPEGGFLCSPLAICDNRGKKCR